MVSNPFSDGLSVEIQSDTEDFTSGIDGAIGKLGDFRAQVGMAGAALATLSAGALKQSTDAARSFEESMVEVEKVLGDSADADAMAQSIREMSEEIPMAQEELAALTADAARFGIRGQENIENFVETTAMMATATDLNAQQAGESMAKLAELTNTPIDEVENLGSSINTLANTSATSSQEIVDAMMRASGELSNLGLTQTEIAALSASLNEVSESSERAGTRLRRLAQELMDPNKVEDLANALGMSVEEFRRMREENPDELMMQLAEEMEKGGESSDQLRESLSTTSQQALTGLGQNLENTRDSMDEANESFEEGESLQNEFESATSTTNSEIQTTKNSIRNLGISIGNVLLPYINTLLGGLNRAIDAFSRANEATDGWLGAITLIGGVVAGGVAALGALSGALGTSATAAAAASGAVSALGTTLTVLTGPIGIAVAAVVGLYAAWQTNLFGIRDITNSVVSSITGTISSWSFPSDVRGKASSAVSNFSSSFSNLQSETSSALSSAVSRVTSWSLPSDLASKASSAVSDFASQFDLVGAVEDALQSAQSRISSWTPDWPDLEPPSIGGGGGGNSSSGGGDDTQIARRGGAVGLDTGGYIKSGGLARLHAGEQVISEEDVERGSPGEMGTTINIDRIEASGYREGREAGRGFVDEVRSAGFRP